MEKPKRKEAPPESEPQYTVSVQLGDKTISYSAESIAKALHDFPRPNKITTKGVLTVTGNGKKFSRLMMPQDMRRILWPVSSLIQAKIISGAMK
jgi:hypothetical protein